MPANKPTYRVAKPNPMFTDEQMVLIRFVKFKEPVECAHCKKKRKNHWTSLIPFRAITFGTSLVLDGESGPLLPGLTPVCGDHLLADDETIMDEMHVEGLVAGWTTPCAGDGTRGPAKFKQRGTPLAGQTPEMRPSREATDRTTDYLARQVHGTTSSLSPAETTKRGVLRPGHSRWIMGYPVVWDFCGATAMQLCRSSRPSSSKRQKKPGA